MATGIPLSQAIAEYLSWLEPDRDASQRTVVEYKRDLERFSNFVGGDVGVPDVAELDRDLLRPHSPPSRVVTTQSGCQQESATVEYATLPVERASFGAEQPGEHLLCPLSISSDVTGHPS